MTKPILLIAKSDTWSTPQRMRAEKEASVEIQLNDILAVKVRLFKENGFHYLECITGKDGSIFRDCIERGNLYEEDEGTSAG